MTQTTVERIATLINEGIDGDSGGALVGHLAVAEIIAAEIDRLTADRDSARDAMAELTTERDQALGELAEARAYISTVIDAPGEGG